jgi:hypothetical protein
MRGSQVLRQALFPQDGVWLIRDNVTLPLINVWQRLTHRKLDSGSVPRVFHPDLGDVPTWLAGIALPLAFLQFLREGQDRRRGQVMQVGAWCEKPVMEQASPLSFAVSLCVRNGSALPVTIPDIEFEWRLRWFEPVQAVDGQIYSQKTLGVPEIVPVGHVGVVAPGSDWRESFDFRPAVPPQATDVNMTAVIRRFVILDNAGRQWTVRPQRAGVARQLRRRRV